MIVIVYFMIPFPRKLCLQVCDFSAKLLDWNETEQMVDWTFFIISGKDGRRAEI